MKKVMLKDGRNAITDPTIKQYAWGKDEKGKPCYKSVKSDYVMTSIEGRPFQPMHNSKIDKEPEQQF